VAAAAAAISCAGGASAPGPGTRRRVGDGKAIHARSSAVCSSKEVKSGFSSPVASGAGANRAGRAAEKVGG